MKKIYFYQSKVGKIGIAEKRTLITDLFFYEKALPRTVEKNEDDLRSSYIIIKFVEK